MLVEVSGVLNVGLLQLGWKYIAHDGLDILRSHADGASFQGIHVHGKLMSQAQDMAKLVQENILHDPVVGVLAFLGGPFGLVEAVLVHVQSLWGRSLGKKALSRTLPNLPP